MYKIMTILGTRPEIIKMSRTIYELDINTAHILVHTGQNYDYELNQIFFEDLEIRKPNYFLETADKSTAKTIANIIEKSDTIIKKEKPDAILFYGDTNSCLAVISAKKNKVPVFHMEAGNRCFDQRVPEEINRKVLDHLSDINLVLTEHARNYLIAEGIKPETIIKTGSHMNEVLSYFMPKINKSKILKTISLGKNNYFIVSMHREENVDSSENLHNLIETLNDIANKYKLPIIVSTHPRTQKRIENSKIHNTNPLVQFLKPFSFCDYIFLQMNAKCVISDSGTITEEASILNLPAITIRDMHERPEGMDEGTLIMSGLKKERVLNAINIILKHHNNEKRVFEVVKDYNVNVVSKKIVRILHSYIEYVNRTVWSKKS